VVGNPAARLQEVCEVCFDGSPRFHFGAVVPTTFPFPLRKGGEDKFVN